MDKKTLIPLLIFKQNLNLLPKFSLYPFRKDFLRGLISFKWPGICFSMFFPILSGVYLVKLGGKVERPFNGIYRVIPYSVGRQIALKVFSITPLMKFCEKAVRQSYVHGGPGCSPERKRRSIRIFGKSNESQSRPQGRANSRLSRSRFLPDSNWG
jgi:hypothetical protein